MPKFTVCFFEIFGFQWDSKMRLYRLTDRCNGDSIEAGADIIARSTSVEISYIDWAIEQDGKFENPDWVIVELAA